MAAPPDLPLLFAARALRLFAYGVASVVLVLHLAAAGEGEARIGLLLTLTLLGDVAVSLAVTTRADRRRVRDVDRVPAPRPGGDRRRPLAVRQRGRPVPPDRAGRDRAGAPAGAAHRDLRLVPAHGRARDRRRRARGRGGCRGAAAGGGRAAPELSAPLRGVRRGGGRARAPAARPLRRSRGGAHRDAAPGRARAPRLAPRRLPALRPLLARRVRRRLRRPELRRVVVPPPLRRGPGGARRDLLRRERARGDLRALGGGDRAQ